MASNRFGLYFCVTTWGESHGPAMGAVVDGCPSGVVLSQEWVQQALDRRAPGRNPFVSPRKESDEVVILSGVFEGRTTGAPIAVLIPNQGHESDAYAHLKNLHRPGHAGYTYHKKYGVVDHRGGGRASARETVARVAAGAVAQAVLAPLGIEIRACLSQVGSVHVPESVWGTPWQEHAHNDVLFAPDPEISQAMQDLLRSTQAEGDSVGGEVFFQVKGVPAGWGEPVHEKLSAHLAKAMLSLPASRSFALGSGQAAVAMKGSQHNDPLICDDPSGQGRPFASNHAGGVLGGISNGMPLEGRVVFKPASSIRIPQSTLNHQGEATTHTLASNAKHDPCVAVRAVPVVEAMVACVLVDMYLASRMGGLAHA